MKGKETGFQCEKSSKNITPKLLQTVHIRIGKIRFSKIYFQQNKTLQIIELGRQREIHFDKEHLLN